MPDRTHRPSAIPVRIARWSATHPWWAILAWFALVAACVGLAVLVPTAEATDADYRIGDSGRAEAMVADAGMEPAPTEHVLVTGADGADLSQATAVAAMAAATDLRDRLVAFQDVDSVGDPQWSPDRGSLLLSIQLARDLEDVNALQKITRAVAEEHRELSVRQAGDVSLDMGIDEQVSGDLAAAEGISLPVTLMLMLLAFGALIAAGIPVLLAITSVAATIGISAPLSHLVHAEPTVSSMIVLIGMAVGVDYSLFSLKREREERARGRTTVEAVEIAAQTSGHSIVVSGLAVIVSLAGLYVVGGVTFNSLATGAIVVVGVAVIGSLTVLPALLIVLGRWVDRPRVPLLWRLNRRIGQGGISQRILAPVVRHPVVALSLSGVVVAALAAPAIGMKMRAADLDTLPAAIPEVQTMRDITAAFPQQGVSAEVVVVGAPQDVRQAVAQVRRDALEKAAFVPPASVHTSDAGGQTTAVVSLALPYDESDERVDEAVVQLREELVPTAVHGLAVDWAVGGSPAWSLDAADRLRDRLPILIGFVIIATMVMMATAFGSAPLALTSMGLNLASVGAAFGVMTLVFQHRWAEGPLDFTSPGFLIDWTPIFVLVVLVGLSMDYHVFVVSRIREHVGRGLPARLAVEQGVRDTAGVVTSAAAVMVSVFAVFAALSMLEMKMLGVGLAVAILLDATLIRLVMLPAILVLLGDRVWWPRRPPRPEPERVEDPLAEELAVALATR